MSINKKREVVWICYPKYISSSFDKFVKQIKQEIKEMGYINLPYLWFFSFDWIEIQYLIWKLEETESWFPEDWEQ